MSGIVYTIEEAVEQTGWSKEKIIKNAQQGNFIIETVRKPTKTYMDGTKRYTSYYDHIIQDEFNKLLELAGKPSITQLEAIIQAQQEEIERLKVEIEALKAQITPPQTESNKTHYDCLEKVISEIEAFKDNPEFIKRGKGIQQGLIEDWLKDRTKSRDERTYLKQLITEHYGITTSRSGNPKQTPQ